MAPASQSCLRGDVTCGAGVRVGQGAGTALSPAREVAGVGCSLPLRDDRLGWPRSALPWGWREEVSQLPALGKSKQRCAMAPLLWSHRRHGSAAAISRHLLPAEVETWAKMWLGRTRTGAGCSPTQVPLLQNATSLLHWATKIKMPVTTEAKTCPWDRCAQWQRCGTGWQGQGWGWLCGKLWGLCWQRTCCLWSGELFINAWIASGVCVWFSIT